MKKKLKELLLRLLAFFKRSDEPIVVFYHDVGRDHTDMGTDFDLFRSHITKAKKCGYSFVRGFPRRKGDVQICFDDGFRGIWDHRDYFFAEHLQPTVFVARDLVGRPGYLTTEEIRMLHKKGFDFQSHTLTHHTLPEQGRENIRKELSGSKEWLSKLLGDEVGGICFPCGYYSKAVIDEACKCGYKDLYSSLPGFANDLADNHLICRNLVQGLTDSGFLAVLRGGMVSLRWRYVKQHFKD